MKFSERLYSKLVLIIFVCAMLFSPIIPTKKAEAQYQLPSTKEYVKTTMDTVTLTGIGAAGREGVVTNEGPGRLRLYFCKQGSITRDSSKYVEIPSGKRFKFKTYGKQIHRQAVADSCLSQVIQGEDLDLGSNLYPWNENEDGLMTAGTNITLKDKILLYEIPEDGTVRLIEKPLILNENINNREIKPLAKLVAYIRKESEQLRGFLRSCRDSYRREAIRLKC